MYTAVHVICITDKKIFDRDNLTGNNVINKK